MRRDLTLPQQAVQACHACIEFARHLLPMEQVHPHLVLLGVASEQKLLLAAAHLERLGVQYRPFYEPDLKQKLDFHPSDLPPLTSQLTALTTQPISADDPRRKHLRRYQCWTGNSRNDSAEPVQQPGTPVQKSHSSNQ